MNTTSRSVGRRGLVAGAAGLGIATLVGGSIVRAQDTPSTGTPDPATETDTGTDASNVREEFEAEAGARYDDFVSRLAGNLGIGDTASVDTAIRTTLTDLADARLAAGEISANDADAARTAITENPAPPMGLFLGGHHDDRGGVSGRVRGGFGRLGLPRNAQPDDDTDDGTDDTTPAATI